MFVGGNMEDLRFYDFEFNLLCIAPDVCDVCWELKFNGIGTFEAGIIPDDEINNVIMNTVIYTLFFTYRILAFVIFEFQFIF